MNDHMLSAGFSDGAGGAMHRGLKTEVILGASDRSPIFLN